MKLFARRALAFLVWSQALFTAAGCDNQGEGARCDIRNLSTDCDEGLICSDRVYFEGVYHQICCPTGGVRPTVAICAGTGPAPDSGVRPDAGTSDARIEGGIDSNAPDGNGSDAADGAIDDSSRVDTGADISPDRSADTAMRDISADQSSGDTQDAPDDLDSSTPDQTSADRIDDVPPIDAAAPDTPPDAPPDLANDAAPDGPALDVMTPIDVVDAPADGGPG